MKEEQKETKQDNVTENVVHRLLDEKKAKLFAKVAECVEDKTKVGELQKIINDEMDEAFRLGETSNVVKEKGEEIIGSVETMFGNILNPKNPKFRQLYFNQRLITANLMAAAQLLQMQLTLSDEPENPVLGLASALGSAPISNAFNVCEKK